MVVSVPGGGHADGSVDVLTGSAAGVAATAGNEREGANVMKPIHATASGWENGALVAQGVTQVCVKSDRAIELAPRRPRSRGVFA